jgi:hypothetical protein
MYRRRVDMWVSQSKVYLMYFKSARLTIVFGWLVWLVGWSKLIVIDSLVNNWELINCCDRWEKLLNYEIYKYLLYSMIA